VAFGIAEQALDVGDLPVMVDQFDNGESGGNGFGQLANGRCHHLFHVGWRQRAQGVLVRAHNLRYEGFGFFAIGGRRQVVFVAARDRVRESVNRVGRVVDDFQDGLGCGGGFPVQLVVRHEIDVVVDVLVRPIELAGEHFQRCLWQLHVVSLLRRTKLLEYHKIKRPLRLETISNTNKNRSLEGMSRHEYSCGG